VVEIHIDYLAV